MKVYRVVTEFLDGREYYGRYESPFFATREAAERFLSKLSDCYDGVLKMCSKRTHLEHLEVYGGSRE